VALDSSRAARVDGTRPAAIARAIETGLASPERHDPDDRPSPEPVDAVD